MSVYQGCPFCEFAVEVSDELKTELRHHILVAHTGSDGGKTESTDAATVVC